jgi:hypothetical protein
MFGGLTIDWHSHSQSSVAQSTFVAELSALTDTVDEAKYMRLLLDELGLGTKAPSVVYVDNNAAWTFANKDDHVSIAKSLPIRFFSVKEAVAAGQIVVSHVPTKVNVADAFTKPLAYPTFSRLRAMMGVIPLP